MDEAISPQTTRMFRGDFGLEKELKALEINGILPKDDYNLTDTFGQGAIITHFNSMTLEDDNETPTNDKMPKVMQDRLFERTLLSYNMPSYFTPLSTPHQIVVPYSQAIKHQELKHRLLYLTQRAVRSPDYSDLDMDFSFRNYNTPIKMNLGKKKSRIRKKKKSSKRLTKRKGKIKKAGKKTHLKFTKLYKSVFGKIESVGR